MADLIIQPLDGLNNGTFDDLEATNIECTNLHVTQDLTVDGNQIFTGNQTVDGSLTVQGPVSFGSSLGVTGPVNLSDTLNVEGPATLEFRNNYSEGRLFVDSNLAARGSLRVYDNTQCDNQVELLQGAESRTHLDINTTNPTFIFSPTPSSTPSPSSTWTIFLSPSTYPDLLLGDEFEVEVDTGLLIGQDPQSVDSTTQCLVEMEVASVILPDTRTIQIPREGTLKFRLPTAPFQGGIYDMLVYFNAAGGGSPWGSCTFTVSGVSKPELRLTMTPSGGALFQAGPTGFYFEADGTSVFTVNSSAAVLSEPLTAPSFSGNGANLTNLSASNVTTGLLPVARGGTNAGVLTANKVMVGNGTLGVLTPSNLHWNNSLSQLGVATATPFTNLDVNGIMQGNGLGLGRTTTGPTYRLEVRSNQTAETGGIIADFQTSGGVTRLQMVEQSLTGTVPASLKNVGAAYGIGLWSTAGPIKFLTGPTGTTAFSVTQSGNGTIQGSLDVGTTLTVGGTGINNAWVRSLHTAGTNTTYNSTNGSFSISDATIRSKVSAGSGISYNSTTGVITNSAPTQWTNFGPTGIYYTSPVSIGSTGNPSYPLSTSLNLEGGFDPCIALNIENLWSTNSNTNVYARFKTAFPTYGEWLMGSDESQNFDIYNTGFNEVYQFAANGTLTVPERLWVGDPTYRPSSRPLEVGYLSTSGLSVGALFNNYFNGSNNFIQVSNRNTTNPAFQNSAYFGVSSTGEVEILEELGVQLLVFNVNGMATFRDDISIRANPGAWDTTTNVAGLHFRYSTNGTQDAGYLQSIIRSTGVLKPMVIQGSEVWLGSERDETSISASRGRVNVYGPTSTAGSAGAHMNFFTTGTDYPTMQLFNWGNDNAGLFFDTYYTTAFTSADAGSNFMIYKFNDQLQFSYNSGTAAGSTFTRKTSFYIPTNGNVQFVCGAVGMTGALTVAGNGTFNENLYGEAVQCNWNSGRTIAGSVSRLTSSAPVATEWIASFNATDTTSGARGVIFTRGGVIIGAVRYDTGAVAYLTTSDYRIKKNVRPYGCGLGIIRRLKPCKYEMIDDSSFGEGFIAHELKEILPHAVYGEKDGVNQDGTIDPQSIDKTAVIAPLVVAVQQLDTKVESISETVKLLGGIDVSTLVRENEVLRSRVDSLEKQVQDLVTLLKKKYVI
jgi:hypothetical protein